jgi:hypothetical protein
MVGLALVEVNPEGLDVQLYVTPLVADAPMEVELPTHIDLSVPAFAVGNGLTVITTASFLVHPVLELVTVTV